MLGSIKTFLSEEDGATTVDMTMLMAAVVGLSMAVASQVSDGTAALTQELSSTVSERSTDAAW